MAETSNINLLGNTTRVETPFIRVQIGAYTFGVSDTLTKNPGYQMNNRLNRSIAGIQYPNYIKSLTIQKINGAVNKYSLVINYPITMGDDPNFFEKVFSSVSDTRKIVFSYGDLSAPMFTYRDEEATITKISQSFSASSSMITYTINAISSATLLTGGAYTFFAKRDKPSNVIKELFKGYDTYGLKDIFTGMRDYETIISKNLIADDDAIVDINTKSNISILDYIYYLVSCMIPNGSSSSLTVSNTYSMIVCDDTTSGIDGPYFKVVSNDNKTMSDGAYVIDYGYPTQNIVTDFQVENNEVYSLFYKFNQNLSDNNYTQRINDNGVLEDVFAPVLSSKNDNYLTRTNDITWWNNMTSYPIKASITFKGLLKPAILMSYVRLNVLYYGRKHVASGVYVVTSQTDRISESGFSTTLGLMRVQGDTYEF